MKSAMGELTDSSNRAEGFSLMPVVWATGATLGFVNFSILSIQSILIREQPIDGGFFIKTLRALSDGLQKRILEGIPLLSALPGYIKFFIHDYDRYSHLV
jgi:hypothetical protein